MCPSKVLGPNVAHAMFFQRYWYIVGDETVNICLQVLNEGRDVVMLNNTLISLIPKVNNPKGIEEYRSIILCIVIYKIIAKAMINRLKSILFGIISPTQSVSQVDLTRITWSLGLNVPISLTGKRWAGKVLLP